MMSHKEGALRRLRQRLKTAGWLGPVISAGLTSGLAGAAPGALIGALTGRKGHRLHDATVGAIVGTVPSVLMGAYGAYEEEKYKEKALREYMARGGYGSEFLYPNAPNGPRT